MEADIGMIEGLRSFNQHVGDVLPVVEAYHQRAGNGGDVLNLQHYQLYKTYGVPKEFLATYSGDNITVWADVSKWQSLVDATYKEPMLMFRGDSGEATDSNASQNWSRCEARDDIQVIGAYCVEKPGEEVAIVNRMKNTFGAHPDPERFFAMEDMESATAFAGPGNHSDAGNKLAELLAEWLGNPLRVAAYANHYDYVENWPGIADWLKPRMITAAYTAAWPGTWAQQYYGGMNYPTPAGLPRSISPWGSNVDLNYTKRSIDQIKADLGLTTPGRSVLQLLTPQEQADFNEAMNTYLDHDDAGGQRMARNVWSGNKVARNIDGIAGWIKGVYFSIDTVMSGLPGYTSLKTRYGARYHAEIERDNVDSAIIDQHVDGV
jgi:hypothetical protein